MMEKAFGNGWYGKRSQSDESLSFPSTHLLPEPPISIAFFHSSLSSLLFPVDRTEEKGGRDVGRKILRWIRHKKVCNFCESGMDLTLDLPLSAIFSPFLIIIVSRSET
ncbi:hypothetical protein L6164_026821 [Bauhinia variegata]|uniref:Uncharacterized protein n=1 Tax=Bauhinia variegata TaxID=167791 RepID=A0ACB9LRP2_BAUVA|nr:hypothetical protein L6164_026821 [Bauhinia variegata]